MTLKQQSHSTITPSFYKKRLSVAFLALIILLVFTHIPMKSIPVDLNRFGLDKAIHAAAYGMLAALFILAIRPPRRWISYIGLLAVFLVITALDERTQAYVGRRVSSMDWAANIVGVLATMVMSLLLRRKKLIEEPQTEETDK